MISTNDSPSADALPPMHADDELARLDATALAARIAAGEVSAAEALDAAIARVEALDPSLGAVTTRTFEDARQALRRHQTRHGALGGVPTLVKDLVEVRGSRTTFGTRASGWHTSTRTSATARELFETGVVSVGKSAASEFGLTPTTEPLGFPPTRNPWDPDHTVGGSSGGAGAAVAAGMVPIAHASDGGGSIRIPASFSGTVGLKPSFGRTADYDGARALPVKFPVCGVISRSVRDQATFHAAVEARTPASGLPRIGHVTTPIGSSLRIGLVDVAPVGPTDPEVTEAARQTALMLEALGHRVEHIEVPFTQRLGDDFVELWGLIANLVDADGRLRVGRAWRSELLDPWTKTLARRTRRRPHALVGAVRRLRRDRERYAELMADLDVLLTPTVAILPPPLGWLNVEQDFDTHIERVTSFVAFTLVQNVTEAPALSVPMFTSASGLPIGIQLAGRIGAEGLLLGLGLQLEQAHAWNTPLPR